MTLEPIIFNCLEWQDYYKEVDSKKIEDDFDYDENSEEDEEIKYKARKFVIRMYGRDINNKSIYVQVEDYKPHFYLGIPEDWNKLNINAFIQYIKEELGYKSKGYMTYTIQKSKKFYGFTNEKEYDFVKLLFYNMDTLYNFKTFILDIKSMPKHLRKNNNEFIPIVYETNINPFMRFIHEKDANATGWFKVNCYKKNYISNCSYGICVKYTDIEMYNNDAICKILTASFDIECKPEDINMFPDGEKDNDIIIQIGTVFSYFGDEEPFYKSIITLRSCEKTESLKDVNVQSYETEKEVLLAWKNLIKKIDPDIITGYNINNFDFKFMYHRAIKNNCLNEFTDLGRIIGEKSPYKVDVKRSAAMGVIESSFFQMQGRVILDLLTYCRRNLILENYKLDFVSSTYINEQIMEINNDEKTIITDSSYGLIIGNYINIMFFDGLNNNIHDEKYKILNIEKSDKLHKKTKKNLIKLTIDNTIPEDIVNSEKKNWCLAKDDVSAKQMFKLFDQGSNERAIVATYCVMDCALVIKLMDKLKVLNNCIAMSNVCNVPLSYIFTRGQGIKSLSLVSKHCRKLNYIITKPIEKYNKNDDIVDEEKDKYEGALVIPPKVGIHYNPICVLDFSSLYPSSIICYNISHECLIFDEYKINVDLTKYKINSIEFDVETKGVKETVTCNYVEKLNGEKGILPVILMDLLNNRKRVKKLMDNETNPFMKKIYDGFQLAYKGTANSIYGILGAPVSPLFLLKLAQSTTAVGRKMLNYSKDFIERPFARLVNKSVGDYDEYKQFALNYFKNIPAKKFFDDESKEKGKNYKNLDEFIDYFKNTIYNILGDELKIKPEIVYGDTDSVFFDVKMYDVETKLRYKEKDILAKCIEIGKIAGETITITLPEPEKQVYEKTLYPLILLSKKRYVGNLYEDNDIDFYQKSMGIVLKRRDNAKIVKVVVGGVVKILLNESDPKKTIDYTKNILYKILRGEYLIDKFIVSKTLKDSYKNKGAQPHAVLTDKIKARGGDAPSVNDRVPYVFITTKKKVKLQSEKAEDPKYVIANNIEIDYLHYIENQIMKPCIQFLKLICPSVQEIFNGIIRSEMKRRNGIQNVDKFLTNDSDNDSNDVFEDMINSIPCLYKEKKKKQPIKKTNNKYNKSIIDTKNIDYSKDISYTL